MKVNIRRIETYERFDNHVKAWADPADLTRFLAVIGPGGTGKTYAYESLGIDATVFRGRSSAMRIYKQVKDNPTRPVIFDDVRNLLTDADSIDLMKQLTDSRERRVIRWTTEAIDEDERQFTFTGSVLLLLNWVPKNDRDVDAIRDRFDIIEFEPSKAEIIARMRSYWPCPEDVDTLASLPVMPTLRTLERYAVWKASAYFNELEELYAECGVPDEVQTMVEILATVAKGKQVKAYERASGKSYEAAKREWTRKHHIAQQLLDARNGTASAGDNSGDIGDKAGDKGTTGGQTKPKRPRPKKPILPENYKTEADYKRALAIRAAWKDKQGKIERERLQHEGKLPKIGGEDKGNVAGKKKPQPKRKAKPKRKKRDIFGQRPAA